MGSAGDLAFQHIGLFGFSVGVLTLQPASLVWQDRTGAQKKTVNPNDVVRATWQVYGSSGHLRVFAKDGKSFRFEGFKPRDKDSVKDYLKSVYDIALKDEVVASDGANYGQFQFKDKALVFEVNDKPAFELSLSNISQCVIPGNTRNEVEMQFHESDAVNREEDALVQIRFHFPVAEDKDIDTTDAEAFQQQVMEVANIRSVTGNVIVEFDADQGTFLTPRGRYTIQMYHSFMRMHGAKYDYKIQYDDIDRLFLLPKPNDIHVAFVISLDKPLRQGQQRYHHLVLQSHKEDAEVSVNLSADELQERYQGQLQQTMVGPLSNLLAKVFKVLSGKKVFIPGNFRSDRGAHAVKCALRANEGLLYPLEKSFIFIHKPPVLIRFSDIESVEFQRFAGAAAGAAGRSFDLAVSLKQAAGDATKEYVFSGIDRAEYKHLYEFLQGKSLRIKNLQEDDSAPQSLLQEIDQQMTAEGYDDEESEEDEDYKGGASDEESSSGSDDDESGAEMVPETPEKPKKKKATAAAPAASKPSKSEPSTASKKRAPAREEKAGSESEGDEGDEGDSPAKKGRKKRDPNAPKAAKTAYSYFQQSVRQSISQENPDKSFGEISRLVSERWKSVSPEEKQRYEEMAQADKQRYKDEMANYDGPVTTTATKKGKKEKEDTSGKRKRAKKEKDPNAPKRATTSFFVYSNEQRKLIKQEQPDLPTKEVAKLIGQRWKALSPEEQERYKQIANQDKERYNEEMKQYKTSGGAGASAAAASSSSSSKAHKKQRVEEEKKKGADEEDEENDEEEEEEDDFEESAGSDDSEEDEDEDEDDDEGDDED